MQCLPDLGVLLPHLAGVVVERVERTGDRLRLFARARAQAGTCPHCGTVSTRVHGRYRRRLADAALAGTRVALDLLVRRFRCEHAGCATVTFAEQVAGLTRPHARYTPPAQRMLAAIGLALAGRAGARLAGRLGLAAGRDTLLHAVRAQPDPDQGVVRTLGVDDFALLRGRDYGTVLIDVTTGDPVDLLPDREAATVAAWLKAHPGVEVVCRDRAGAYAEGARTGAPDATQVADRWHLWHNLADHTVEAVTRNRTALRAPAATADRAGGREHAGTEAGIPAEHPGPHATEPVAAGPETAGPVAAAPEDECASVRNARERFTAVQRLEGEGLGVVEIGRRLGLAKPTVSKYVHAAALEDVLLRGLESRPGPLDPYKAYLYERFRPGVTTVDTLFREIRRQGYRGSSRTVARYLSTLRHGGETPAAEPGDTAAAPERKDVSAGGHEGGPGVLDPYKDHLRDRFRPGVTGVSPLFREIQQAGYTGSYRTVARYLRTLRPAGRTPTPRRRRTPAAPPAPPAPKVRDVAHWILTHPDRLEAADAAVLDGICERHPPIAALRGHVAGFAEMLTGRHGDRLDAWLTAVEADDQPDLHAFARGIRRDHAAVLAGLTLPHSSGVVEGTVNRIKMLKRQMYGRAKFDLLPVD